MTSSFLLYSNAYRPTPQFGDTSQTATAELTQDTDTLKQEVAELKKELAELREANKPRTLDKGMKHDALNELLDTLTPSSNERVTTKATAKGKNGEKTLSPFMAYLQHEGRLATGKYPHVKFWQRPFAFLAPERHTQALKDVKNFYNTLTEDEKISHWVGFGFHLALEVLTATLSFGIYQVLEVFFPSLISSGLLRAYYDSIMMQYSQNRAEKKATSNNELKPQSNAKAKKTAINPIESPAAIVQTKKVQVKEANKAP